MPIVVKSGINPGIGAIARFAAGKDKRAQQDAPIAARGIAQAKARRAAADRQQREIAFRRSEGALGRDFRSREAELGREHQEDLLLRQQEIRREDIDYSLTATQRAEWNRLDDVERKAKASGLYSDPEFADFVKGNDLKRAGIKGGARLKPKPKFPEGRGPGDTWISDDGTRRLGINRWGELQDFGPEGPTVQERTNAIKASTAAATIDGELDADLQKRLYNQIMGITEDPEEAAAREADSVVSDKKAEFKRQATEAGARLQNAIEINDPKAAQTALEEVQAARDALDKISDAPEGQPEGEAPQIGMSDMNDADQEKLIDRAMGHSAFADLDRSEVADILRSVAPASAFGGMYGEAERLRDSGPAKTREVTTPKGEKQQMPMPNLDSAGEEAYLDPQPGSKDRPTRGRSKKTPAPSMTSEEAEKQSKLMYGSIRDPLQQDMFTERMDRAEKIAAERQERLDKIKEGREARKRRVAEGREARGRQIEEGAAARREAQNRESQARLAARGEASRARREEQNRAAQARLAARDEASRARREEQNKAAQARREGRNPPEATYDTKKEFEDAFFLKHKRRPKPDEIQIARVRGYLLDKKKKK